MSWFRNLLSFIVITFQSLFMLNGQARQLNNFYGNNPAASEICVRAGNFSSDLDVENLVIQILEKYGVKNRFIIVPCDRTSNAQAIVDENGRPYILYNPEFLMRVKSLNFTSATLPVATVQDWERLAILAHEIGHHLNYHLLSPHPDATPRSMELEADETAGHILYLLGATLVEAQKVMYSSAVSLEGGMSHPPRAQRLAAIERGYLAAEKKFPKGKEFPPKARQQEDAVDDLIKYNMVLVKGGTFQMGSEKGTGAVDEYPRHPVTLSDFYIGKYEVTNKEWREVMGEDPPLLADEFEHFTECGNCPVVGISWIAAQKFISKLNNITGQSYRLPTEAEWEYAASGGIGNLGNLYAGSNNADEAAWYKVNSGGTISQVGKKKANELGLHDMSGNVWEWCHDYYAKKYTYIQTNAPQTNPRGPSMGEFRIIRGGSYHDIEFGCRTRFRNKDKPDARYINIGFRLVRE